MGRSYDRFGAFAVLQHGGDFSAAARALGGQGTGNARATAGAVKESVTSQLLALAMELYEPVMDVSGEPDVIPLLGPKVAVPLKSSMFTAQLAASFHSRMGKTAGSTALNTVTTVLHGQSMTRPPVDLALHSAVFEGGVVLDLGGADGGCVTITATGWSKLPVSPVTFRRTKLTSPLPDPVMDGALDRLREVLNVHDEAWPLLLAWQVTQLLGLETPVAAFTGEAGTGKTTAARIMVSLTDPSPAPVRSAPSDEENWIVAASGSRVVALDNISGIPQWLSDTLCKAVTGDALVRRQRYTDTELAVIRLRRAVVLTCIHPGAVQGDLAERLLPLELEPIASGVRLTDADVQARWQVMHPIVLGGLLDLTVKVIADLPAARLALQQRPRMASFAEVLYSIDRLLGTNGLQTYLDLSEATVADVLDGDLVAQAIIAFAHGKAEWSGPATELLKLIEPDTVPRDWPGNAAELGRRIARVMSVFPANRIEVERGKNHRGRTITIRDLDHAEHAQRAEHTDGEDGLEED